MKSLFIGMASVFVLALAGPALAQQLSNEKLVSDAEAINRQPDPEAAFRQATANCSSGLGRDCLVLGLEQVDRAQLAGSGEGLGLSSIKRGCDLGYAPACVQLGDQKLYGKSIFNGRTVAPPAPGEAYGLMFRACTLDPGFCFPLGGFQQDGIGHAKDLVAARKTFTRGCAVVPATYYSLMSCAGLGALVAEGGAKAEARRVFGSGCGAKWVPEACAELGLMLMYGEGGPKDLPMARERLRKGCVRGAESCVEYGGMLEVGEGGGIDIAGAQAAYDTGCVALIPDRGHNVDSCIESANLWLDTQQKNGKPVLVMACRMGSACSDRAKAIELYLSVLTSNCTGGDSYACYYQAERYAADARLGGAPFALARQRALYQRAVKLDPDNEQAAEALRK